MKDYPLIDRIKINTRQKIANTAKVGHVIIPHKNWDTNQLVNILPNCIINKTKADLFLSQILKIVLNENLRMVNSLLNLQPGIVKSSVILMLIFLLYLAFNLSPKIKIFFFESESSSVPH